MLELAKHLVDEHRASMLDELTIDRESPLQWAGQAGHLAVCQMLVESGALMGIRNRRRSTSEEEARQDGHYHVTRSLQGCHHLGTRGGLGIDFAAAWADGRTVAKAEYHTMLMPGCSTLLGIRHSLIAVSDGKNVRISRVRH